MSIEIHWWRLPLSMSRKTWMNLGPWKCGVMMESRITLPLNRVTWSCRNHTPSFTAGPFRYRERTLPICLFTLKWLDPNLKLENCIWMHRTKNHLMLGFLLTLFLDLPGQMLGIPAIQMDGSWYVPKIHLRTGCWTLFWLTIFLRIMQFAPISPMVAAEHGNVKDLRKFRLLWTRHKSLCRRS